MERDFVTETTELRMALRRVMGDACERYSTDGGLQGKAKQAVLAVDQFLASLRECQMGERFPELEATETNEQEE